MRINVHSSSRSEGLEFLKKFYPAYEVNEVNAKEVLDLAEAEIIRIPDPQFHPKGGVMPAKNWNDKNKTEIVKTLQSFQDNLLLKTNPFKSALEHWELCKDEDQKSYWFECHWETCISALKTCNEKEQ